MTHLSGSEGRPFYSGRIKILEDTIEQLKDDLKNAHRKDADNELEIISLRAQLNSLQQAQGNANADIVSLTAKIYDILIDLEHSGRERDCRRYEIDNLRLQLHNTQKELRYKLAELECFDNLVRNATFELIANIKELAPRNQQKDKIWKITTAIVIIIIVISCIGFLFDLLHFFLYG